MSLEEDIKEVKLQVDSVRKLVFILLTHTGAIDRTLSICGKCIGSGFLHTSGNYFNPQRSLQCSSCEGAGVVPMVRDESQME